jgi:hypothetical protein
MTPPEPTADDPELKDDPRKARIEQVRKARSPIHEVRELQRQWHRQRGER